MLEAVSTSETSVNSYQTTWRNMPEDSHFHTRRRENLKSHLFLFIKILLKESDVFIIQPSNHKLCSHTRTQQGGSEPD
jgi:hypothetical protein